MAGLEDRKLPTIPKKNDSLGSDSGLENLKPTNPFIKSGNDSLGGDSGLDTIKIPASGRINTGFNGDGLAK
jgi:hypothetical protein